MHLAVTEAHLICPDLWLLQHPAFSGSMAILVTSLPVITHWHTCPYVLQLLIPTNYGPPSRILISSPLAQHQTLPCPYPMFANACSSPRGLQSLLFQPLFSPLIFPFSGILSVWGTKLLPHMQCQVKSTMPWWSKASFEKSFFFLFYSFNLHAFSTIKIQEKAV